MSGMLERCGGISPDNKKMLVHVILAPPGWWAKDHSPNSMACHCVQALVDTGATVSGISKASIKQLKLRTDETAWFVSADRATEKPVYKVDVGVMLPTTKSLKKFHNVSVREIFENKRMPVDEGRTQMLLGMDIILHGALHVEDMRFRLGFNPTNPAQVTMGGV